MLFHETRVDSVAALGLRRVFSVAAAQAQGYLLSFSRQRFPRRLAPARAGCPFGAVGKARAAGSPRAGSTSGPRRQHERGHLNHPRRRSASVGD
ncbi:hypothetical protein [Hymenobacter sp. YC55]|uniref:hypothetical protein n=1 Tax=Hymenobacter sp. YC55 TaxID=3034019 RepID=UPI0023F86823|nr:hypothetical protein [Hymenobacter sp. YC55]MDF7815766.1 hypothetical protein [Hymenobacter sp. YC55]